MSPVLGHRDCRTWLSVYRRAKVEQTFCSVYTTRFIEVPEKVLTSQGGQSEVMSLCFREHSVLLLLLVPALSFLPRSHRRCAKSGSTFGVVRVLAWHTHTCFANRAASSLRAICLNNVIISQFEYHGADTAMIIPLFSIKKRVSQLDSPGSMC